MIIDLIILILFAFGFLIGFHRGFTNQLVSFLGILLILALSFILKNPLSVIMYKHLPFFSFHGISALNILTYKIIAFFIIFSILSIILKLLLMITKVFENVLQMTILLGLPSKIMGGILGILESYIIIFVVLYFMCLPVWSIQNKHSKIANFMLNNTPIISRICDKTLSVLDDVDNLTRQYKTINRVNNINYEAIKLFNKYDIISEKNVEYLKEHHKL